MNTAVFHLAFPVNDLDRAEDFYTSIGATVGRRNRHALILGLGEHQIVAHLTDVNPSQTGIYPRHFGLIFPNLSDFDEFERGLGAISHERRRRFDGEPIAHWTLVLRDPDGNVLEFKCYDDPAAILGWHDVERIGDTDLAADEVPARGGRGTNDGGVL